MVGYSPMMGTMDCFITANWNFTSKPKAYFPNDRYFVVRSASIEDRDVVLYFKSYTIGNRPIIFIVWSVEYDFQKEVLQTIPSWVKLPKLPLSYWEI